MSKSLALEPEDGFGYFFRSQRAKPPSLPESLGLEGKTALITGASSGIGLEAARQLLQHGLSHLVITARTEAKGASAASSLRAAFPDANIDLLPLEMTSYDSIRALVREVEALPRLDMAILNAGGMKKSFRLVPETGHEEVVQVNYLSTILLAVLLLPILKAKRINNNPARLTIVNTSGAYSGKLANRQATPFLPSFNDPKGMKWDIMDRYFSAKALGHLLFPKLTTRIDPADVIVNLVDPGLVKGTGLHGGLGAVEHVMRAVKAMTARSTALAATCYLDAVAVKGAESHGCFVMDWEIRP
jgi:NAD(P)-dependent dehydrogenase (short-subunit alcohol dehydrogenase family)